MYSGPLHDPEQDPDYWRITPYVASKNDATFPDDWSSDATERDLVGMWLDGPTTAPQGVSIATFLIPRGAAPVNLRDYRSAKAKGWGDGWPSCSGAQGNLVTVTTNRSGSRFNVHRKIAVLVDLLADETERRGYLGKPPQCGAYNCRPIGGTKIASNHSFALALDWNWQENPFSTTALQVMTMPLWMPELWNKFGFAWGGDYTGPKKDCMHLEFMGTPAQADLLTDRAVKEFKLGSPLPVGSLPVLKLSEPRMTGSAVEKVQKVIKAWYRLPDGFVDGVYGPATVEQVKRVQVNGTPKLTADGVVGSLTYAKLGIKKV